MKKILFVLLACSILLCGCSNGSSRNFSSYSKDNMYLAMLPTGVNIPTTYDEVLQLKGESQYTYQDYFPIQYKDEEYLYYDDEFLGKSCISGLVFEEEYLTGVRYIYKASSSSKAKNIFGSCCSKLTSIIGEPNFEHDYIVRWERDVDNYNVEIFNESDSVNIFVMFNDDITGKDKLQETTVPSKATVRQTTTTAYEWKLNTNSTGKDWNSVNDTEKEVWCSNSITAWKVMGYDIPSDVSIDNMKKYMDSFYSDSKNNSVDIVTVSEAYAILKGIY